MDDHIRFSGDWIKWGLENSALKELYNLNNTDNVLFIGTNIITLWKTIRNKNLSPGELILKTTQYVGGNKSQNAGYCSLDNKFYNNVLLIMFLNHFLRIIESTQSEGTRNLDWLKWLKGILFWTVQKYQTVNCCWIANILEPIMSTAHIW